LTYSTKTCRMSSKEEALARKAKGNEAYKARNFTEAIAHFKAAYELDKDVVFLNNLAAAQYENGQYDESIETAQKAVDDGRDTRADYKTIAKSFGRIGTAYLKKEDYENAIKFFNKSLTEHRTPDILQKLKDTEKAKAEADRKAYIDPALSDKAREEGNVCFKAGDFAGSVKHYTEAIKRNPEDPKAYNNRATAYTKLLALNEALKDAESAIKIDPKFVKAYIRKSHVKFAMKEYTQASDALAEAKIADTEGKNKTEISQQERKIMEAMYTQESNETDEERVQRAMRDPEVAKLLQDPTMQSILQQAQDDPKALMEHMKNPVFRSNIQKLQQAGIVKMGSR